LKTVWNSLKATGSSLISQPQHCEVVLAGVGGLRAHGNQQFKSSLKGIWKEFGRSLQAGQA
jgi:hypothetical protein